MCARQGNKVRLHARRDDLSSGSDRGNWEKETKVSAVIKLRQGMVINYRPSVTDVDRRRRSLER